VNGAWSGAAHLLGCSSPYMLEYINIQLALHTCWNTYSLLADVERLAVWIWMWSDKGTVTKQVKAHCMPGCINLEQ
jgi:hypothetical protein